MSRLSSRKLSVLASYIYDGAVNKPGTRSRISYFSDRPLTIYAIQEPCRAEDHDYIGNYEFKNGRVHRVNTPYGYMAMGMFVTYLQDYQGNNRNHTDYYAYGLPVQGSEVKDPDPCLYGSKEFYSLKGVNLYDFNARTYAPDIARFMQPDPLATENHGVSPYTYCNGDPINNIDLWGLETLALDKKDSIQTYASNVADDPQKLTIYSHGNYSGFNNNVKKEKGKVRNGAEFIEAVKESSAEFKDIENQTGLEIELKSCNAGADNPESKPNIAKKVSEALPNVFVTGPNGRMEINYTIKAGKVTKLYERVLDQNDMPKSGNNLMTTYFRGQKIDPAHIPAIRSMLRLQSRPIIDKISPPLLPIK